MAETAITAVLSKLGELAVSEARLLLQVKDDIVLLRDRLEWLHAFVRDADRRRRAGAEGLTWVRVRQTRDVAFEAEDALDEFFYDEVIRRQGYGRVRKILHRYFTCFFTQIVVRHGLSGRIESIKNRLDQISQNQKEYNIEHIPWGSWSSFTTTIAAWHDDLENAVGFDEDVDILLRMLHNDKMFIISIIGESGVGKNTLAKIIRRKMPEMEVVIWYDMEPGCHTEDLLVHLIRCAKDIQKRRLTNDEYMTLDKASRDIRITYDAGQVLLDLLRGTRYLLILSGISSKQILNSLWPCLPDKYNGSHVMLILDIENEEIARHANTKNRNGINGIRMLTRLDRGRSGQLFCWKDLRKRQSKEGSTSSNPKDSEYSRLVYEITGGYPMAISLLAGLLRFKEKPAQWDAVLQQLKYECETQGRQANLCGTRRAMEIIFWTSFEDLPNDLKSCFLYFAGYPKSYSHSADMIVRMWIAEGFIKQTKQGKSMEELGNDYLKELVLRCLIEVEEIKVNGEIMLFRVHKSLMGLLLTEVREAGFMEIHNTDDTIIPPSVRRLSVQSRDGSRHTSTFADKKLPKLRSFICHIMIIKYNPQELKFLRWSKFIRVISVRGLNIKQLPDEIGDLINLRYLRIDAEELYEIPSSIARLLNLQTLDISNTKVEEIDKDFWKIKMLRHVLASCLKLPGTVSQDGGSKLQTLHGVIPDDYAVWSEGNCPLDNMANLRSLEMHGLQFVRHCTAFRSALKKMRLLGHLHLEGDLIPLYVLTHPYLRSLQTMVLDGRVMWDSSITADVLRRVRPNLVQLKVKDINQVPQSIKEQLGEILVEG